MITLVHEFLVKWSTTNDDPEWGSEGNHSVGKSMARLKGYPYRLKLRAPNIHAAKNTHFFTICLIFDMCKKSE